MKDLLKIKWEMHKGVNYIFYAIVIVLGILIGLGLKKIINLDFNFLESLKSFFNSLIL